MSGSETLEELLSGLESGKSKERTEAIENLKRFIRAHRHASGIASLSDEIFHTIHETLFGLILREKAAWLKATKPIPKSGAEGRLWSFANALRIAIEAGGSQAKSKTFKALFDHILYALPGPGGHGYCPPLALEHIKSLRILLSHAPHVEHLAPSDWSLAVTFCIERIGLVVNDLSNDAPGEFTLDSRSEIGHSLNLSHRSSRSLNRGIESSQQGNGLDKDLSLECLAILSSITGATNAPFRDQYIPLITSLIGSLQNHRLPGAGKQYALVALNNVLLWTRTESISATTAVCHPICRVARSLWLHKTGTVRDETLIALLYLQPFLQFALDRDGKVFRHDLEVLYETIRDEYGKRQEKDQLQIEDISLHYFSSRLVQPTQICLPVACLQSCTPRAERCWATGNILASFALITLQRPRVHNVASDRDIDDGDHPTKRQKANSLWTDTLQALSSPMDISRRLGLLQMLFFAYQKQPLSAESLSSSMDALCSGINDDIGSIASWSFLVLFCCAAQSQSHNEILQKRWLDIWHIATRAVSNPACSRTAAYLLEIMIRKKLITKEKILGFVRNMTVSLGLNGPGCLTDATAALLILALRYCQELLPSAVPALAENILAWTFRNFTPRKFADLRYATSSLEISVRHIESLIQTCMNHRIRPYTPLDIGSWTRVGQAWLHCQQQVEPVSYLLLTSDKTNGLSQDMFDVPDPHSGRDLRQAREICESVCLSHFRAELTQLSADWTSLLLDRGKMGTPVTLRSIAQACCIMLCVLRNNHFTDSRRQTILQHDLDKLMISFMAYLASVDCDQACLDASLRAFTESLVAFDHALEQSLNTPASVLHLCDLLDQHLKGRLTSAEVTLQSGSSQLELDDFSDTEESQDDRSVGGHSAGPTDHLISACSLYALRCNIALYSTIITASNQNGSPQLETTPASIVVDYITGLPPSAIFSARRTLNMIPRLGIILGAEDAEVILAFCADSILAKYSHNRSEVALCTILDIMLLSVTSWTDKEQLALFELGVDMYDWFTRIASEVLSPYTEQCLALVLLKLYSFDPEYGRQRDGDTLSTRTSLFGLLARDCAILQHFLADRIHSIFAKFVLQTHGRMFDDIQANLPSSADWKEGMALRLLFLTNMAARWRSLLRQCIYYIFETAGQVSSTANHAAFCIKQLTASLGFSSAQRLFRAFAPQLLFTWLANNKLTTLPYAAFGYSSLHHILHDNRAEIAAQLLARGPEQELAYLVSVLATDLPTLAELAFAKAFAYAVSWDVVASTSEPIKTQEMRIRDAVGTKEKFKQLVVNQFPTIMGHFFLTVQQGDVEEGWMRKRSAYGKVAEAYDEMKGYGSSSRSLPPSQQPSFAPKTLFEKIERLCRRAGQDHMQPWTRSSYPLVTRMLCDAFEPTLGSLYNCLMLRRMRLLISIGGDMALSDFALEMLLSNLRPLLSDSECAVDAIGMLQYLFHHGRSYLTQKPQLLSGCVLLTILQMSKHSISRQNSTTQESQHTRTVERMREFQKWLTVYVRETDALAQHDPELIHRYINCIGAVQLPGNATKGSAESELLLITLDQLADSRAFLSRPTCHDALVFLARNFQIPHSIRDDCLGDTEAAQNYKDFLWHSMQNLECNEAYSLWAARVIGRAFAISGIRPSDHLWRLDHNDTDILTTSGSGTAESQHRIITTLSKLIASKHTLEASLADHTLRRTFASLADTSEATSLSQILPDAVAFAIWEGTFGYRPSVAVYNVKGNYCEKDLRNALFLDLDQSDEAWLRQLGLNLCQYGSHVPLVSALLPIVDNLPDIGQQLLLPIIHLLLAEERGGTNVLKHELSASLAGYLEVDDRRVRERQQFFLKLLLYLRGQEVPGEVTVADRLRWLNVDFLQVSVAAIRCKMPAASLLFAESVILPARASRRSSGRAISQAAEIPGQIEESLLLEIFTMIDEPDLFYGVKQAASLTNILSQLEYEGEGLQSLIFHSALSDSMMRSSHKVPDMGFGGAVRSLAMLNLDSLTYALMSGDLGGASTKADDMLDTARRLQQWDVAVPDGILTPSASCFLMLQQLSRATHIAQFREQLQRITVDFLGAHMPRRSVPSHSWFNILASFAETAQILDSTGPHDYKLDWASMNDGQHWTSLTSYRDCNTLVLNRSILFGTLSQNRTLREALHITARDCTLMEAQSLVDVSRLAIVHGVLQESLSASSQLHALAQQSKAAGLNLQAIAKYEMASALWSAGQSLTSNQLLREILTTTDVVNENIVVGRSGVLAKLGHQLAEARLERPDEILDNYLSPAIKQLKGRVTGDEAGQVYHEFASFCDQQLQNPGNTEDFERITKLRKKKKEDLEELEQLKASKKVGQQRTDIERLYRQTKTWLSVDDLEYRRLKSSRDTFLQQSLQNYMLALRASDKHNIRALRFFALWLENWEIPEAVELVEKQLPEVPSWKFVVLLNQIMSRLDTDPSIFQKSLRALATRICADHPYHSLHHLFAFTRKTDKLGATQARFEAAMAIRQTINKDPGRGELLTRFFKADNYYSALAGGVVLTKSKNSKVPLKEAPYAEKVAQVLPGMKLPPATISLPLQADGEYDKVPRIYKFGSTVSIMGGISAPKMLVAIGTDGKEYRQLFKSGNDDLRQDAIMEQVFEEVSKMLRNHKLTRQRNLHVRTYKVIPLSPISGIIEFVSNTTPLDEFLQPAHKRYNPADMRPTEAREKISAVKDQSTETRVKEFRKICERIHPVLRYFFIEKFNDPDEWFEKRVAYTRTTAAMSMLGHVLGLGDRHCSNILLDERSGDAVHIDLGIAFEAGRVLPIPELVPFRLTRDIVDGMGITKTEGTFRRCCELTMDALREDKESIMTLLNVLRYDPLHSWTVSPLRAKRMQEAASRNQSEAKDNGERVQNTMKKQEQEAGEADRALSIVEKKLSKTLSTSATVNDLIQQATDERNLATLFQGWAAFF